METIYSTHLTPQLAIRADPTLTAILTTHTHRLENALHDTTHIRSTQTLTALADTLHDYHHHLHGWLTHRLNKLTTTRTARS